ncbi:hypothetical protein B5E84_11415 [Lachnoclostridium sp. An14]|uniref:flagellin lysine-N-methylase n=1 Tax=Lachnoclostridium sp. An14 TaxID=1965562 RepID=UPI000B372DF7|nr:flagellin lysine-N-methylase [Lachnoclostridium sp. An14]OUQ16820.1 hypothetical protein B5E84_11415 [Lachnoclostridium sp. An14]
MRLIYPSYYHSFSCQASQCPDTCCKGWRISIDGDTLKRYEAEKGPEGEWLREGVDHRSRAYRQKNGRCVFLDRRRLCGLFLRLGEAMMCRTCRVYPRHKEPYGDRLEISLSLSCPAAAQLILNWAEPVEYRERIRPDREGEPDQTADRELLEVLLRVREAMWAVLRGEGESAYQAAAVLALAHDGERRLAARDCSGLERVCRFYESPAAVSSLEKELASYREMGFQRRQLERAFLRELDRLEMVSEGWEELLFAARRCQLGGRPGERYERSRGQRGPGEERGGRDRQERNLLEYFLYLFYAGGVYEGGGYGKAKLAAFSLCAVRILAESWRAVYGGSRERAFVRAAYLYSRQLEHSDRNLGRLERFVERDPSCALTGLLACLLG